MQNMLDDLAAELPEEFFKDLNGGIVLLPEAKLSPEARANDLYILGTYHRSYSMGRYISIYYGSFEKLFEDYSEEMMKKELRKVLRHEFTHHMESLAGERELEKDDDRRMAQYLAGKHNYPRRKLKSHEWDD